MFDSVCANVVPCRVIELLSEPYTLLIAIVDGLLQNTIVCLQKNRI